MAEYIERYALLNKLCDENCHRVFEPERAGCENCYWANELAYVPAADVVPVVRCRDCKHLRPEVDAHTQETIGYWCAELDIGSVDVDDFCSRGERMEEDHE